MKCKKDKVELVLASPSNLYSELNSIFVGIVKTTSQDN